MGFTRKSSEPRDVVFTSQPPAVPKSAPSDLREWFEQAASLVTDDHETIEAAFAALRREIGSLNVSASLAAILARLDALEARPTGTTIQQSNTTETTIVQAEDELTANQRAALQGTYGGPNNMNRFVTSRDPRLDALSVPAGTVVDFAGADAPDGWLMCDGSAVSRETYAALFDRIGVVFGAGDGSTTFNLPDCRGRSPMGAGTGTGLTARTLGQQVGAETHTLTAAQSGVPAHSHTVPWRNNTSGSGGDNSTGTMTDAPDITVETSSFAGADASQAHPNIHPVIVLNRIIKF